jgi:hypothetical protein
MINTVVPMDLRLPSAIICIYIKSINCLVDQDVNEIMIKDKR